MNRIEILALSICKSTGGFDDPTSRAFKIRNPGLLKTYRPEKKVDSENYRVFTSFMGGFKALTADLQAKCSGKNRSLTLESPLKDLLVKFGFRDESAMKSLISFLRRSLDDSISTATPLSWFLIDAPEEK